MEHDDATTQAEFARQLGAARTSIVRAIKKGMPVLAGGRIPRVEALQWLTRQTSGWGGGWCGGVRGQSIAQRAQAVLNGSTVGGSERASLPEARGGYGLLDHIRSMAAVRLPELARRLGLPEFIAVATPDVFDSVLALCGADTAIQYEWPSVAEGPTVSRAVKKQADAFTDETVQPLCDAIFAAAVLANPERYPQCVPWAREVQKEKAAQKKRTK